MVTVSPSGPPGLFKGVTTPMSGVLTRFPLLLPVRNSFAGDKRGNRNVTWFPADVWPGLGMYFPRLRKRGLGVCPGLKRRELELGRRRLHRKRST